MSTLRPYDPETDLAGAATGTVPGDASGTDAVAGAGAALTDSLAAAPPTAAPQAPAAAAGHDADRLSADPHAEDFLDAEEFAPEEEASPWRDTTASAVFGVHSYTVPPARLSVAQAPSLTDNPVFQSFVLLLAATYAMLLYRNLADVALLLNRVSRDRASGLSEEPGANGFPRFLHVATAIGMLFVGVMAVKYGDSMLPRVLSDTLSHGAVVALSLSATTVCVAVVVFQRCILRAAGALVLAQSFVLQLLLLKRTYFSLAVIICSPFLLLFALCPRGTGDVWFCTIVAGLLVTAVLYLRETLNLFISKKVSILHWFLYLCTVEVFPISLLWLLAAR